MGFIMDYAVPAIIGALISIFMDKIAVHYIKVVLRSERMPESLENMVKTINTVSQNSFHIKEKCGHSLIHGWDERLQELVGEASRMVEEHRLVGEHRGFSRVRYKLNILSRYRRSKEIANLISDMSKHLKLVPVVQLECVLSLISNKRSLPIDGELSFKSEQPVRFAGGGGLLCSDFIAGIVGWVITSAFLVIFFYIGRLCNFKKKLASFRDLTHKIDPFVIYSKRKIHRIQHFDANQSDNWLNNASNWVDEMKDIIREGDRINETRSPIARCKKSEQITELTSRIDAHLNQLSWITLDLLFHEIEGPTDHPIPSHEIARRLYAIARPTSHPTSPQATIISPRRPSTSSQETLTPRRPSTASQETEGSTSDAVPSYETEGSTIHPIPFPQGVCIPVVSTGQSFSA